MRPEADRLERGAWRIVEQPDGWTFELRLRLPLKEFMPSYLRANRWYLIGLPATWFLVILGMIWSLGVFAAPELALLAPALPVAAVLLSLLTWPLRLVRRASRPEHRFRYFYGNRTIAAHVHGQEIDVRGAAFPVETLRSLQIVHGGLWPARVGLSFSGDGMSEQRLVDWPGIDKAEALEVMQALRDRAASSHPGEAADPLSD